MDLEVILRAAEESHLLHLPYMRLSVVPPQVRATSRVAGLTFAVVSFWILCVAVLSAMGSILQSPLRWARSQIFRLKDLVRLDLGFNNIKVLPDAISIFTWYEHGRVFRFQSNM